MTDTDKELLELAAKAAGIRLHVWGAPGRENFADMDAPPYGNLWNPLKEDADALRLAVKLGLTVTHDPEERPTEVGAWTGARYIWIKYAADPYAATRRAIVRAAATIAKDEK